MRKGRGERNAGDSNKNHSGCMGAMYDGASVDQ